MRFQSELCGGLADRAERISALRSLRHGRFVAGIVEDRIRVRRQDGLRCDGHQSLRGVVIAASTLCRRSGEGLNDTTRLAEIGASSPVFGLRPTRAFFRRTTKLPKRANLTSSSRSSSEHTSSSTRSRKLLESCLVSPTFWTSRSTISARVRVFSGTQRLRSEEEA